MARDFGKSSRGGLRGSCPEPGLGWKRASVRLWCSIMRLLASNCVRGEFPMK